MKIGQLAARTGVSTKTIRYYEDIGVLALPDRAPNGYRQYDADDVDRLLFVRDAQAAGLSLDEIRHVHNLKRRGVATCEHVIAMLHKHLQDLEARIASLQSARRELLRLTDRARGLDPEMCTDPVRCQAIDSQHPDRS